MSYRFTPNAWGRLDGGTLEVAMRVLGGFPLPPFVPPYNMRLLALASRAGLGARTPRGRLGRR